MIDLKPSSCLRLINILYFSGETSFAEYENVNHAGMQFEKRLVRSNQKILFLQRDEKMYIEFHLCEYRFIFQTSLSVIHKVSLQSTSKDFLCTELNFGNVDPYYSGMVEHYFEPFENLACK